jgi:hypothetical protein
LIINTQLQVKEYCTHSLALLPSQVLSFLVSKITMADQAPHVALAPAFANPDIFNYSDQSAAKLFKADTDDFSIKFDGKTDNLQLSWIKPGAGPLSLIGSTS